MVQSLRRLGLDPRTQLPFNFIFRGPLGRQTSIYSLFSTKYY